MHKLPLPCHALEYLNEMKNPEKLDIQNLKNYKKTAVVIQLKFCNKRKQIVQSVPEDPDGID